MIYGSTVTREEFEPLNSDELEVIRIFEYEKRMGGAWITPKRAEYIQELKMRQWINSHRRKLKCARLAKSA